VGGKVAAALAAVALLSASASVVGVIYTGVVSVRYDLGGAPNFNAVADRARSGKSDGLDATKVRFGPVPDSPAESGTPCRDDFGTGGCFVVYPSPDLKFSFFGYTISLPAEWYNYDFGDDLYRGGEQRFLALFSDPDLVTSNNAPDSTGQEDAATIVNSDGLSRQTQSSDSHPILSDANAIYAPNAFQAPNVNYDPNVIDVAQPAPTPSGTPQSPVPSLLPAGPTATIPEPSTWPLILTGCAALALARVRWARETKVERRRAS
jgi:hypothetical protein